MNYIEYADFVKTTDLYKKDASYNCTVLIGLVSELGEYCDHIKKYLRGDYDTLDKHLLVKELGDILWYATSYYNSRMGDREKERPVVTSIPHPSFDDNVEARVLTSELVVCVMELIKQSMEMDDEEFSTAWNDIHGAISDNAKFLGYTYEDVLRINYEKLSKRLKDGTIKGSGDNR